MALGTGQSQVFGHPPECWHTVVCPRPTKCVSCQFTDGASDILITQHVSTLHQTLYTQNKLLKCGSLHGIQNNTINKPTKHSTRNLKCNNRNLDLVQKSNERKESLNLIVNVWSGYINVASISQGLHTCTTCSESLVLVSWNISWHTLSLKSFKEFPDSFVWTVPWIRHRQCPSQYLSMCSRTSYDKEQKLKLI